MALTISTGFVVDDAIVVHRKHHAPPGGRACRRCRRPCWARSEIGFTVLSMSMSLVAVFIPILLMGGIVGRLFREFAVTLSVAIGVSLVVSLTTTPMMCAHMLKPKGEEHHNWFFRLSEGVFERILGGYDSTLSWVLRHQPLTLAVTLATFALSVYLYITVPKGFFPQQDVGRLNGQVMADQSISFQSMNQKMNQIVGIVMADPAVDGATTFFGGQGTTNVGRMFVTLKSLGERKMDIDHVIARLRPKLARVPGATLILQAVQDVRIGGRMAGAQYQYTLQGDDFTELVRWAPRVAARLVTLNGLTDINSDQQDKGLEAALAIDRGTASRLGVSAQQIDNTLYDAFGQSQVSTMYTQINQYHVVLVVTPQFWQNPDGLKEIYLATNKGTQAPLATMTRYLPDTTPLSVNHRAVPVGDHFVQSRARRSARHGGGEIQDAAARDGHAGEHSRQFHGHRAGLPGLAGQRADPDPGRAPGRLHRARHSLRELHPPDHDSLDAALGRRRRVARADGSATPISASSR